MLQKYHKTLDSLKNLMHQDETQRFVMVTELQEMSKMKKEKSEQLEKVFNKIQEREKEVGKWLINKKTGKPIPEKLIEKLIKRQKVQIEQVSKMQLKCILLKDMVKEKQEAIMALDNIGEGLHLSDYEQLKIENRKHADKIEVKDEELTRLRSKYERTIKILEHTREKSNSLKYDIDEQKFELNQVESLVQENREKLNYLKQKRDNLRIFINDLEQKSGSLTEPELLKDMDTSIDELARAKKELAKLKEDNAVKGVYIKNIRKNLEIALNEVTAKRATTKTKMTVSKPKLYKGRPSLFQLALFENISDHLGDLKRKGKSVSKKKKH